MGPPGGGWVSEWASGCECTLCRPLAHGPAAALGVDGWGGWRSAAAVVLGVGVVDGWGSSRLPASSTKRKNAPTSVVWDPTARRMGCCPAPMNKPPPWSSMLGGGGGDSTSHGWAEQGASIRHELAAVWIPDRGGDGGDDRPAASRIPALRTAGRPHVRRITAAAVGFGAAAEGGAVRLHNRRFGGVLGRLKGRSSILGHYSGPDALGVRAFRLGGCRESGWSAVRLS